MIEELVKKYNLKSVKRIERKLSKKNVWFCRINGSSAGLSSLHIQLGGRDGMIFKVWKDSKRKYHYELEVDYTLLKFGKIYIRNKYVDVQMTLHDIFGVLPALMVNAHMSSRTDVLPMIVSDILRSAFIGARKVTMDDIVGLDDIKTQIKQILTSQFSNPLLAKRHILLCGPPGTGKSLLLKAVAEEFSDRCVIGITGVDEFERWLPLISAIAEAIDQEIILLVDEIDELTMDRTSNARTWDFLRLLSGVVEQSRVTVVATTNRPDLMDEALFRPERFSPVYEVPPPDAETRRMLFEHYIRLHDLQIEVDSELASMTKGWSGAKIREAVEDIVIYELDKTLLELKAIVKKKLQKEMPFGYA